MIYDNTPIQWDRSSNPRRVNHRVADAHLFPNPAEKMRNHLAEDMIEEDMLHLMKIYIKLLWLMAVYLMELWRYWKTVVFWYASSVTEEVYHPLLLMTVSTS